MASEAQKPLAETEFLLVSGWFATVSLEPCHIQVRTLNSFYYISIIFSNKMSSKILFKWMLSFMNTLFPFKYNNIKVYI